LFIIFALYYEPAVIFSIALVSLFVKWVNEKMETVGIWGRKCGVRDEIYYPYLVGAIHESPLLVRWGIKYGAQNGAMPTYTCHPERSGS
jgi:hypothetical protein